MSDELGVRASNAERARVADALYAHASAGRLSVEEMSERTEATFAARTLGDLQALLADLPPETGPSPRQAERLRRMQPWLRTRWAGYGAVVVICLVVLAITSIATGGVLYSWPMWVAGPWGLALLAKTVGGLERECSAPRS